MYAVEVSLTIQPDQAFYHVGDPVKLSVSAVGGARITARIMYLNQTLATFAEEMVENKITLEWTPPRVSPRGYGIDVKLYDAAGRILAEQSSAFDVLDHWTQAPRYGFLTEFTQKRVDPDITMAWATRYHLNGLQFYDWQYRHEILLPPEGDDTYSDLLGREMSLSTVKALIDAAHRKNIAAMPYTAIYGASATFYRDHPDWALYRAPDKPYEFGDDYLMIMNPAPDSPWTAHLLDQYAQVLDQTKFDGIHIDQYGAPMRGRDAENKLVKLDEAFPEFINATVELVDEKRGERGAVIFNLVRNWPLETVAPSEQDAVYIEVWEPYRNLLDLYRIIAQAQRLSGGKPVILAAYIHPEHEINVRLANAFIYAAGGYHLELGEPHTMLADPYFPKFGAMDDSMQSGMLRLYDFVVRYENVLSLDTHDATSERASALTIDGIPTQGSRSRDRVAVIVRAGEKTESFNLINLIGIDGELWEVPITQAPIPQQGLTVQIEIADNRTVKQVYSASPDGSPDGSPSGVSPQTLEFIVQDGKLTLTDINLEYWSMIVVEYQE